MTEQVEISSLDLRYENCRLKAAGSEKTLLVSILQNGIRDPLQGVDRDGNRILLDGFKRRRCAGKLGINYDLYWGSQEIAEYVGLRGIPHTLVIDKQGRVVRSFVGYRDKSDFEEVIKPLL